MSAYCQFYIIDATNLPTSYPEKTSRDDRLSALSAIVKKEGAQWCTIEMSPSVLEEALKLISGYLGPKELLGEVVFAPMLLPHLVRGCSPPWLLGGAALGYFSPELVRDLWPLISQLEDRLDNEPKEPELEPLRRDEMETVFYELASSIKEAWRRAHAIVVLHSW